MIRLHSEETFPEINPDFTGPCLIEVVIPHRSGRGRFWCDNGRGYTDSIDNAGVYPAEEAKKICEGSDNIYPVSAMVVHNYLTAALTALTSKIKNNMF